MGDSNTDRTFWSGPCAVDTMLPSFELAEMMTALTLNESQHEIANTQLHETCFRTNNAAYATKDQTMSSSSGRFELSGSGHSDEQHIEHEKVLANYQATMLPLLQSLFPREVVQQHVPDSAETADRQQEHFRAAQIRFLIFSAINNFAGVLEPDLKVMHYFLSSTIHDIAEHTSKAIALRIKLIDMPSAKPMAETFFRCAIEVGDDIAARSLLLWNEVGISAIGQVCVVKGQQYTPVERAAQLQHAKLTQVLIEYGADVNKSFCCQSPNGALGHHEDRWYPRHGALENALSLKQSGTDVNLITTILQHKGELSSFFLKEALRLESSEVVHKILSSRIAESHQRWMEQGALHEAIYTCEQNIMRDLIIQMRAVGADLNTTYTRRNPVVGKDTELCATTYTRRNPVVGNDTELCAWETELYPPHLVDIAAQRGELEIVKLLFSFGAAVTADSLPAAINGGDIDLVRLIIQQGPNVHIFSPHYRSTPYADVLRLRNSDMLRILRLSGFSINNCDEYSLCAILAAAAEIGDLQLVKRLVLAIKSEQILGWAMCKAVLFDKTDVAVVLLNAGAAVDQDECVQVYGSRYSRSNRYPKYDEKYKATFALYNALRNRNHVLVRALLEHNAVPFCNEYGVSPLEMAVRSNDQDMIETLISAGARLESWYTGPVVAIAVQRRYADCARFLVRSGAGINDQSYTAECCGPPLAEAIRNEDTDMIRWLLANGANPVDEKVLSAAIESPLYVQSMLFETLDNVEPGDKTSIAHSALTKIIEAGEVGILRHLVQLGLQTFVNVWPTTQTPLAAAIRLGNKKGQEMLQLLLDFGMNVDDIVSWRNRSALYSFPIAMDVSMPKETGLLLAIETRQVSIVQFLLEQGADINRPAKLGIKRTPLQKAAEVGSYTIVQLLLNRGAAVNAPPAVREGGTALQMAAIQGFVGIVELLLEWHADANMAGSLVRGRTAIQGAAEHGRFDMVKYLHNRCFIESQQYTEAARLAKENGHIALSEMIRSFEADLRTRHTSSESDLLHLERTPRENVHFEGIGFVHGQLAGDRPEVDELDNERTKDNEAEVNQRSVCASCNANMSNLSALRRHERTVHGTQSHLQCPECPRRFRRRDNLRRHQNTHKHPYQKHDHVVCSSCSKSCRKDYLPRHQRACLPLL